MLRINFSRALSAGIFNGVSRATRKQFFPVRKEFRAISSTRLNENGAAMSPAMNYEPTIRSSSKCQRLKHNCPDTQDINCILEAFSLIDLDENGVIDHSEMHSLAVVLGNAGYGDVDEISEYLREIDVNGDGVISQEEFVSWWMKNGLNRKQIEFREAVQAVVYSEEYYGDDRFD
ncbi:hypothetical protein GUITHDRAFT_148131 [Guillardia theta CCMP2712]|uniref:EF-hand domain-containing protein n=1 Tax=Guillardia theta (strain CCMP2712) TaxID=905079 RepID=L1IB64_GUITC|nr:hypothetical protein GUITHDRAFT_148131 [Guillardia theta CCMP2712]EKX33159.1 hypothetical protein GUITHDRAFT_148131 [Guillardia theta CCMP2712]|eukprot:XP_005820139.1 hypothetical protein GUITHDRAFT_148131 [Guillardia theta CCMP2712]